MQYIGWEHDDRKGHFEKIIRSNDRKEDSAMTGANYLLQSRRFWTLLLDAVLSITIYFVGKYFSVALDDVKFLIVTLQPIALILIAAYTVEDVHQASLANQLLAHQSTLATQVKAGVVIALIFLVGILLMVNAPVARAEAPTPAQARFAQEPQLACVAIQVGLPADWIALKKIAFDTEYGAANQIVTSAQWADTFKTRMQLFTAKYGLQNVADENGAPLKWCKRLIAAQQMFLAP